MFSRSAETKVESNVDERRMRKVFMVLVLKAIISVVQVKIEDEQRGFLLLIGCLLVDFEKVNSNGACRLESGKGGSFLLKYHPRAIFIYTLNITKFH